MLKMLALIMKELLKDIEELFIQNNAPMLLQRFLTIV